MERVSFLFNCNAIPNEEVTEVHAFGPTDASVEPKFHADLSFQLAYPNISAILAITDGRLFLREGNLFLQPLRYQRGEVHPDPNSEVELLLFDRLFHQPFVFCYKNLDVSIPTIHGLLTNQANRAHRTAEANETYLTQKTERFNNSLESIYVHAGDEIGYSKTPGNLVNFEIFFIPNGITEFMPERKSGLDIIFQHYTNSITRRLDPLSFFACIPDPKRINYKTTDPNPIFGEHRIFARFTKRFLVEIRDEYDNYFTGTYGSLAGGKPFSEDNHGMISLIDFHPGDEPTPFGFNFSDTDHVFCMLPSGGTHSRTVVRRSEKAPYYHAVQRIYMKDLDDPRNWFGSNTLERYTENNRVEFLIDGKPTFERMLQELDRINSSDHYVLLAGWFLDKTCKLSSDKTVEQIFTEISNTKRAKIKVIIWQHFMADPAYSVCRDAIDFINRLDKGSGILDDSIGFLGSHHQKIMIIKNSEGIIAFCGGVDINKDRLDDPSHLQPDDPANPFHDVHSCIKGPAAKEINRTFIHRWNMHYERVNSFIANNSRYRVASDRIIKFDFENDGSFSPTTLTIQGTNYSHVPSERLQLNPPPPEHLPAIADYAEEGRSFVQVTRTYSQRYAPPFQPSGEVGTLNAIKQAISRAKKYIYIEDQFFCPYSGGMPFSQDGVGDLDNDKVSFYLEQDRNWGMGLVSDLYEKVKHNPNIVVIILTPGPLVYDPNTRLAGGQVRMELVVRLLKYARQGETQKKIYYCYLKTNNKQIYIHSKLWIIDDIYVKIGSANCNRRSLTSDSEIDIHIIDGKLENGSRKAARQFRKILWSEHFGIRNPDRIDDLNFALWLWEHLPIQSHIAEYPYLNTSLGLDFWSEADPEGRVSPPNNPTITSFGNYFVLD
jgi:phosphatidylserine/phosphatidylglycerophosphate/cardiolipin synthase-like enzyme